MTDESTLHIVTALEHYDSDADLSKLAVDEPFGVIQDHTYDGRYYLVRWPEDDDA